MKLDEIPESRCRSCSDLLPGFDERAVDSYGFSADGTLISAFAVPKRECVKNVLLKCSLIVPAWCDVLVCVLCVCVCGCCCCCCWRWCFFVFLFVCLFVFCPSGLCGVSVLWVFPPCLLAGK